MEKKSYLLYPTDKQKENIENTFSSYMNVYNSLIQYSRNIGKEHALQYSTKPKLYRLINNMKYENKDLSILDNSTIESLVNTYMYDLDKSIKKNRRFPLHKTVTAAYTLDNVLNSTTVDFYNTEYVKLNKLGYVRTNSNVQLPINCNIDKATILRDKSSNYHIQIEYDNEKSDNNREKRKEQFLSYYNEGKLPDGSYISDSFITTKKYIKYDNSDRPINTQRIVISNSAVKKQEKKHIVSINYIHRDYVKKLDEYNHAKKLYAKHPEKFDRGVLFGHTIVIPKEDGVNFDVIYDSDPLSTYRKWNVKMPEKEKEIIKRKCQDRMIRFFPELYENYNEKRFDEISERIQKMLSEMQVSTNKKSEKKKENNFIKEEEFYDYDLSDIVETDNFTVKDIEEVEEDKPTFVHVADDDELAQLLLQSNLPKYPSYQQQQYYQPKYQISGNTNWQYSNNYYNSQY